MKRIKSLLLVVIAAICFSCSEKDNERIIDTPTFKLTAFGKVENLYTATMEVKGLHGEFSIDGLIKEDEINSFQIIAPNSKPISYTVTRKYEDVNLITIYGKCADKLTIKISWICKQVHENYLVGWHLDYGFGDNCEVLMINLQ